MSVLDELREQAQWAQDWLAGVNLLDEGMPQTAVLAALPALLDVAEAALEREDLIRRLAQSPPACHPLEFEANRKRMKAALARLRNAERAS